jgi:hypothetical protein
MKIVMVLCVFPQAFARDSANHRKQDVESNMQAGEVQQLSKGSLMSRKESSYNKKKDSKRKATMTTEIKADSKAISEDKEQVIRVTSEITVDFAIDRSEQDT